MRKLTPEMCDELLRKARNCRDNAKAEMAVHAAFIAEYMDGLSSTDAPTPEKHTRSMELYDFTIKGGHRARDFLKDAELFEAAAEVGRAALREVPNA